MTKIKYTTYKQIPYIKFKHNIFFGFKIHKLPRRFNNNSVDNPIKNWFNLKGFTFIHESEFEEALKRFPELEEIITEMWYLDHNKGILAPLLYNELTCFNKLALLLLLLLLRV